MKDRGLLSFQTVVTVDDVTYEHLHTTIVDRIGDIWIVDEHALINGELTTVRLELVGDFDDDASSSAS